MMKSEIFFHEIINIGVETVCAGTRMQFIMRNVIFIEFTIHSPSWRVSLQDDIIIELREIGLIPV